MNEGDSLYQSVDNSNMVTVVCEAPSVDAVKQFRSNPELKVAMEKGSILGMPDVRLLSKV